MNILVVDDEGIVLDSCRRVLEAEGFEVSVVDSADKAIEFIEKQTPALLLIDIMMPVHDGLYLMRELKLRGKVLPIVVMSGYGTGDTINEAEKMGADQFIAKPFTPGELLDTVLRTLKRRKQE